MSSRDSKWEYSWEDLRPVHPLFVTVLVFQFFGAGVSAIQLGLEDWHDTIWLGGALATLPGFVVGLLVQRYARPGSVACNRRVIVFMGVASVALFAGALILMGTHVL